MNIIQIVAALFFFALGIVFCIVSAIGIFRMKFVMNRMHAAALADSCGLLFIIIGLMILSGLTFMTLKLAFIVVVFWLTSPVSGHLLSNLIKSTMPQDMEKNAKQKALEK